MADTLQIREIDRHFADFISRLDEHPCAELWLAAMLVSAESGRGHVCLDLAETVDACRKAQFVQQPPEAERWLEILRGCSTVGHPGEYRPLVLDDAGRLYLYRSWNYERMTAEKLIARGAGAPSLERLPDELLERLFPQPADGVDLQREAALVALTRQLTVISGGPGTGKTSTVARILVLLLEQAGEAGCRIALAAPTGKAAGRLRESIVRSVQEMPIEETLRQKVPQEVKTIHRLLGVIPDTDAFRHNRDNPLGCDVLVVDEVSMVDLPLMAKLLDALRPDCRLILLGDRDQLASVEAGAVLADICSSPDAFAACGKIGRSVVHLTRSYRFGGDSGIGNLSRAVNMGDGETAFAMLTEGTYADIVWRTLPEQPHFETEFARSVRSDLAGYHSAAAAEQVLAMLDSFRVLSPLREGPTGVENLNRIAMSALGLRQQEGQRFCQRMPVMVTGNDYELGLFNGDTAVLMSSEEGRLEACFADREHGIRSISALRMPPFETAFALTVHKSQGSEFDKVLLILPETDSELLTRELIYTAITRAKKRVEIWGCRELFCRAVARRIRRHSGLVERLWG